MTSAVVKQSLYIPVSSPEGTGPWHLAAWLSAPERPARSELQILLHGATYDHRYWDWPVDAATHSYVEWASRHGAATLNIDRLGAGFSSHPHSSDVSFDTQALAVRDLISAARHGTAGMPAFERVVLVGHSMGSALAGFMAAQLGDVDALVLTGYLPLGPADPEATRRLLEDGHSPASSEVPALRGLVDDGYITTPPGRASTFFHLPNADPDVVTANEAMRGTATVAEFLGAGAAAPLIRALAIPTLCLNGEYDVFLRHGRDTIRETVDEARLAAADNFDFQMLADAGHNLSLQLNAHAAYEAIAAWLEARAAGSEAPNPR